MPLINTPEWELSKKRYAAWWNGEAVDRALIQVDAPKKAPADPPPPPEDPGTPEGRWLGVDYRIGRLEQAIPQAHYAGDAFPHLPTHIGPGTLSLYLGSVPTFSDRTVWYNPCCPDITAASTPHFDPDNRYWQFSLDLAKKGVKRLKGKALVCVPDLIEALDTVSSLVGNDKLLFYLVDAPQHVHRFLRPITDLYFQHFEALYQIIKDEDGGCCFTAFYVYAPGRMTKLQCDMSAMISPKMFREFEMPYLEEMCRKLDYTVYHLDGEGALQHLDALLEIKELNAIQWTPGAGKPNVADPVYLWIHKRIREAGKSSMVLGPTREFTKGLVEELGPEGLLFHMRMDSEEEAEAFVKDSFSWKKR